ncbi:MAG: prepilin-type N-terminal cleavage/methylation domain-containing protein [Actinobacteria bacterium]|nr:prepilin-type N-terminal cleavage/methylation domain-containing protein [Actinomycetota bacterium]
MMSKFRASRERDERGFTLIELLVVILIIAILAAIAIPVFLNQREKGWVSQTESALKNAATAAESYATGNQGKYTGLTLTLLEGEGFKKATDVTMVDADVTVSADGTAYCIDAGHASLGTTTYGISSDTGAPALGTCATGAFTAAAP